MVLDEKKLAESLSNKYRLDLSGCVIPKSDGNRYGIRTADLQPPKGFMILVNLGWKSIEADFIPDNYAGDLIRAMGSSLPQARNIFSSLMSSFRKMGSHIQLNINGSLISEISDLPPSPWNKFELNFRKLADIATESNDSIQKLAEDISGNCLTLIMALLPLEEDDSKIMALYETGLPEGACTKVTINRYERSNINRAACISVHGSICNICSLDFGKKYGSVGQGFIEIHHKLPVSQMGGSYLVDPIKDLIPVCSNCHSMMHRADPPLLPEQLRDLIKT